MKDHGTKEDGKVFALLMQSLSLFRFGKVYPLAILFASAFFGAIYFLTKPNEADMAFYISMGASVALALLALYMYAAMARAAAVSHDEKFMDGDEYSIGEILAEARYYLLDMFLIVAAFLLAYNIVIPFIGAVAGGIFQVNIGDMEFNVLTLGINYIFVVWLLLGTAQIAYADASFVETISMTARFLFDHCLRTIGFVVFVLVAHLILQAALLFSYQIDPIATMPGKVLLFAYVIALTNAFATSMLAADVADEEYEDDEYEED